MGVQAHYKYDLKYAWQQTEGSVEGEGLYWPYQGPQALEQSLADQLNLRQHEAGSVAPCAASRQMVLGFSYLSFNYSTFRQEG